jgi:hypothetical protein
MADRKETAIKWEYQVKWFPSSQQQFRKSVSDWLSIEGERGWELVTVLDRPQEKELIYYLKRRTDQRPTIPEDDYED